MSDTQKRQTVLLIYSIEILLLFLFLNSFNLSLSIDRLQIRMFFSWQVFIHLAVFAGIAICILLSLIHWAVFHLLALFQFGAALYICTDVMIPPEFYQIGLAILFLPYLVYYLSLIIKVWRILSSKWRGYSDRRKCGYDIDDPEEKKY